MVLTICPWSSGPFSSHVIIECLELHLSHPALIRGLGYQRTEEHSSFVSYGAYIRKRVIPDIDMALQP